MGIVCVLGIGFVALLEVKLQKVRLPRINNKKNYLYHHIRKQAYLPRVISRQNHQLDCEELDRERETGILFQMQRQANLGEAENKRIINFARTQNSQEFL